MRRKLPALLILVNLLFSLPAYPAPEPCAFSVSPDTFSFPANGGSGKISVKASDPGCTYEVTSRAPWMRLSEVEAGAKGEVAFSVDAYGGEVSRIGTISVAGKTITVVQFGSAILARYKGTPTDTKTKPADPKSVRS